MSSIYNRANGVVYESTGLSPEDGNHGTTILYTNELPGFPLFYRALCGADQYIVSLIQCSTTELACFDASMK